MENGSNLKNLLGCLNHHAFAKYVFELYRLNDGEILEEGDPVPHTIETTDLSETIGEYVFEQHRSRILQYQEFTALFLYTTPIDLFNRLPRLDIAEPAFLAKIQRYKDFFEDRAQGWFYPQDGELMGPQIAFITNYSDLNREDYDEALFPKFDKLLDDVELGTSTFIGSLDSFAELGGEDAKKALESFISNYRDGLSISLVDDRLSINPFLSDRYIADGVLRESQIPCEPVFAKVLEKGDVLAEFEHLLNHNPTEDELEDFLKRYYQDIFGFQYDRVETQIWLRFPDLDISNSNRRLDIFLRNSIQQDWDLFELKKIVKLTKTYRGDVPVFRSEIMSAIQQLRNYNRILSQDKVKKALARDGIEYYCPSLHLVVGRNPNIPLEQWRWLKSTNEKDVKIITYDDLLLAMRKRLQYHLELLT